MEASARLRLIASLCRLCCILCGVTSLWILGALVYGLAPSFFGVISRRMTNFLYGLSVQLRAFFYAQHVPDIILLGKTEELSNLGCSLRAKSLGVDNIGQAWDVAITLLDDRESEHRQILCDDASSDRLSLSLTSSSWSVA